RHGRIRPASGNRHAQGESRFRYLAGDARCLPDRRGAWSGGGAGTDNAPVHRGEPRPEPESGAVAPEPGVCSRPLPAGARHHPGQRACIVGRFGRFGRLVDPEGRIMARYRITGPDGATYEVTAPDGATDAEILDFVRSNAATAQPAPQAKPAGRPTIPQRVMDSPVGSVLHGMRKPLDAWAEYAPWAIGTAAGAVGLDQVSQWALSEAERVRAINQEHERFYQES